MKKNKIIFSVLFAIISMAVFAQDKAKLVIARNNGFAGSGAPAHVFINNEYMGKLQNDNYVEFKTVESRVKVAIVSNFGAVRAISIPLSKQQTNYVNVNLSKSYALELASHNDKLKQKVISRASGSQSIIVADYEKQIMLEKHSKKLEKIYTSKKLKVVEVQDLGSYAALYTDKVNVTNDVQQSNTKSKRTIESAATAIAASPQVSNSDISLGSLDTEETVTEIGVTDIYENYLTYIDPAGLIKNMTSLTRIANFSSVTKTNEAEIQSSVINLNFKTANGKVVSIMKSENMNSKTVFNGTEGYTELSTGYKMDLTPDLIKTFKNVDYTFFVEQSIPDNALVTLKEYNGTKVYCVKYIFKQAGQNTQMQDYYDTETFEKVLSKQESLVNGETMITTVVYQDYKEFESIKCPGTIITEVNQSSLQMKSVSHLDYKFNEAYEVYADRSLESTATSLAAVSKSNISLKDVTVNNVVMTNVPEVIADTEEELRNSDIFNNLNKREQAHQLVLVKQKELGKEASTAFSTNTAVTVNRSADNKRISRMEAANSGTLKYRRSSLYTLMLDDNAREHYDVIKDAFGNTELSDKFNDHNIGPYLIPAHSQSGEDDQTLLIEEYLNNNGVARNLVAKWFNRDENGHFNMNLIAERGQYNASEIDLKVANASMRGKAMLSDAGKELINNTFVVVYDYEYTNKADQARKRGGLLNVVSTVASYVPGGENVATISSVAGMASDVVGKGYYVRTRSYLYRLVWNDEIAEEFYNKLWIDETSTDNSKKEAFDKTDLFKLKYIGNEYSRNNLQSTIFSSKSNEQLIEIATTKAVDKNIGKLQRNYEEFRVKTPLLSVEPIAAKIGLKEDIEKNDKFEVLEQVLNEDGTTSYERVAIIKVDKKHIWDNTFLSEEVDEVTEPFTVFKGNSKNLAPGMLIRQIN